MATATLSALRAYYPAAHITFAVGGWSRHVINLHPHLDAVLDVGAHANPARHPRQLARRLRAGGFDLAISLERSPLMSAALWLSGIPHRAGLDSAGRGFCYTVRVPVNPAHSRHEAQIYLDVAGALGAPTAGFYANVPLNPADVAWVQKSFPVRDYVVIAPVGGQNPGMTFDAKRWPVQNFAALADAITESLGWRVVLIGGPQDGDIVEAVEATMQATAQMFIGALSFGQIAALAHGGRGYIGNDTGLTHLAAAAGARTVMILGPSDPARYAPFVPDALALWKPTDLQPGGVASADVDSWDWARDGISAADAIPQVLAYLRQMPTSKEPE